MPEVGYFAKMDLLYRLFIQFPVLLFSITVHEYFHGLVAEKRGDDTARLYGRLTLNPIAHIDLFGTIILPLFAMFTGAPVFGWAKPVPVNPYHMYNPKRDMMFVGLAGPVANFSIAFVSAIILRYLKSTNTLIFALPLFQYIIFLNVILCVFNLTPIPPLDGSRIISGLLPSHLAYEYEKLTPYGFFILIFLLMSGLLWGILGPVVMFFIRFLMGSGFMYG